MVVCPAIKRTTAKFRPILGLKVFQPPHVLNPNDTAYYSVVAIFSGIGLVISKALSGKN